MKILFFTDVHSNKRQIMSIVKKAKDVDLVVCLGDVSFFEHALPLILNDLDKIGKTILMLPGNHEDEETLRLECKKTKHIKYFHETTYEFRGVTFFSYGSAGFVIEDEHFEEVVKKNQHEILEAKKLVLVTHQPPFNTSLDNINGRSVGNMNIKDFIIDYKPIICASGHIHDNFYAEEMVKETLVFNPGPKGKIVDLENLPKIKIK